jgi:hypothetical protein
VLACALGLGISSLWNTAQAFDGPIDQLSYMTFSQPVAIPGATLPAGEYIFRLPDRSGARMVLQVLSRDGSHVYGMFLTRPTSRTEATADPAVTFHESAEGMPLPIRAWFYANERFGLEFAYPEAEAQLIAAHADHPVLTTAMTYVE